MLFVLYPLTCLSGLTPDEAEVVETCSEVRRNVGAGMYLITCYRVYELEGYCVKHLAGD